MQGELRYPKVAMAMLGVCVEVVVFTALAVMKKNSFSQALVREHSLVPNSGESCGEWLCEHVIRICSGEYKEDDRCPYKSRPRSESIEIKVYRFNDSISVVTSPVN